MSELQAVSGNASLVEFLKEEVQVEETQVPREALAEIKQEDPYKANQIINLLQHSHKLSMTAEWRPEQIKIMRSMTEVKPEVRQRIGINNLFFQEILKPVPEDFLFYPLLITDSRARFAENYKESVSKKPLCRSRDGERGVDQQNYISLCHTCKFNKRNERSLGKNEKYCEPQYTLWMVDSKFSGIYQHFIRSYSRGLLYNKLRVLIKHDTNIYLQNNLMHWQKLATVAEGEKGDHYLDLAEGDFPQIQPNELAIIKFLRAFVQDTYFKQTNNLHKSATVLNPTDDSGITIDISQ